MEEKQTLLEVIFENIENFLKINLDLFKLKAIDKTADVVSSVISKIVLAIAVLLVIVLVSIGGSIWIGSLVGEIYYGFFIVAGFYVLLAIILFYQPNLVKKSINDSMISNMLNPKNDENENTQYIAPREN